MPAAAARGAGRRGTPGRRRRRALDVAVLDDGVLAALDPDGTLLCNVNTADDYARARRLATVRAGRRE
jgi:hypothetical protein